MRFIDNFLNSITMYRLMLYLLIILVVFGGALSFLGILPFSFFNYCFSVLFLLAVSWIVNKAFAKTFGAPTNVESVYISALIISLIITPAKNFNDIVFLGWAATLAMSSKYILSINKKHIFNPVAISIALTAFAIGRSASWWVGTDSMLPIVLIGGIAVVRKLRRFDMVGSFLVTALAAITTASFLKGIGPVEVAQKALVDSPILFFAFVMLIEPQTFPPTRKLKMFYGALVGFLFSPQIHAGSFYMTPEIALVGGNIFSYLVSPKEKLILKLKEKKQIAPDIYDFVFETSKHVVFRAGQHMEWTLGYKNPDSRGNRRYFTIASSPTEKDLRIGVKFYKNSSSFKKALSSLDKTKNIVASQLSGDFTLPKDPRAKSVFIAGGIGVTPYRSMVKYLLDKGERRDVIIFYSARYASDFVYKDIFNQAEKELGIRTIYVVSDKDNVPPNWHGKVGTLDGNTIIGEVPDYKQRNFYLSGPRSMVDSFKKALSGAGVGRSSIKTDYFPGYA